VRRPAINGRSLQRVDNQLFRKREAT
jgi:hypothetical protein